METSVGKVQGQSVSLAWETKKLFWNATYVMIGT